MPVFAGKAILLATSTVQCGFGHTLQTTALINEAYLRMIEWNRCGCHNALDLNPNLSQPHFYIARAYYHLGLLEFIEPEVRAGLEINPDNLT